MDCAHQGSVAQNLIGQHDTLLVGAVIYQGDTIEAKLLTGVYVYAYPSSLSDKARWTRLRNAVYVTYPYARRAALVFNDINKRIAGLSDKRAISDIINSKEKQLKKEFTDPLTNLSVYQGKILMKLINRETGNNCYNIIREMKGGFTARFYQTIAFFFGSNLKQTYDAKGEDADIETIVKEVQRLYGYTS